VPHETAIKAFRHPARDPRLENSFGYPDWFLLRRGRRHETFEIALSGGRSRTEQMVVAAYGPLSEGRAIVDTKERSPFGAHAGGATSVPFHQVVVGLEIPTSGKPSWTGDYPWDARFTGQTVVNWVREGFGMGPVGLPVHCSK
jgi:hypothetical protein